MKTLLKQPYPLDESRWTRLRSAVLFGGFVFLFLFVFRPFQLGEMQIQIGPVALGYGIVCFAIMVLLNLGVFSAFPNFFNDARWTVGREMFWIAVNVFLIGLGNYLYSALIGIVSFEWGSFLLFQGYTFAVGVFPLSISILLIQARLRGKFERGSHSLNAEIKKKQVLPPTAESPKVELGAGAEKFLVSLGDFLYAKADDNYVEVYSVAAGGESREVIRDTLKNVAAAFQDHGEILRCHKSYVVNLKMVDRISGNAQGYKLHLKGSDEAVPVSRTLNGAVKAFFADGH